MQDQLLIPNFSEVRINTLNEPVSKKNISNVSTIHCVEAQSEVKRNSETLANKIKSDIDQFEFEQQLAVSPLKKNIFKTGENKDDSFIGLNSSFNSEEKKDEGKPPIKKNSVFSKLIQ